MFAKDLLLYQFGDAGAIRRVAGSRYLLLVAAVLVVMTSVPRNYDQTYIGEVPWWPVMPLLSSLVTGSFLYWVLQRGFLREAEDPRRFRRVLGLFWMTAPVAWLYGIPVERFLDVRGAAVANLWLLGIVALWRVVQVVLILFFAAFGEGIGRAMAGMRNSPEQNLIVDVLGVVFWTAFFGALVLLIFLLAVWHFRERAELCELPESRKAPWLALLILAAAWLAAAIVPQGELAKEYRYVELLNRKETRDALAYLNTLEPEDWPAAKSFRPDPYEFEVWDLLPPLMAEMTGNEKRWVQEKFLWVFERTFDHRFTQFSEEQFLEMLKAVEKFERGKSWIEGSDELWTKSRAHAMGWTNLVGYLDGHGVKLEPKEGKK